MEPAGAGECLYFGLMTASPEETADEARKALRAAAKESSTRRSKRASAGAEKTVTAEAGGTQSFLQELANLLARRGGEGRYLYNGRAYRIHLERSADGGAAKYFRERGLVTGQTQVARVSGRVRREAGGRESEFRLWVAEGTERPLPLRIEYQPKPYLRLAFEAEAGTAPDTGRAGNVFAN